MFSQQKIIEDYLINQPVQRAYLFGSAARGDMSSTSDLDLLVELLPTADLFDFARMQIQLQQMLSMKVDLVSTNGISKFIKPFIDKDKVLIYERPRK